MRVLAGLTDDGGCGNYRLGFPSKILNYTEQAEVVLDSDLKEVICHWDREFTLDPGDAAILAVKPIDYDVLVLQRPVDKHLADSIPFIRNNGTAVVVELDDDFWSIDSRNIAAESLNQAWRNCHHLERAIHAADLVTVSTPELSHVVKRLGVPPHKIRVLSNYVPEEYLTRQRHASNWEIFKGKKLCGWSGTPLTHPGDLEEMGWALMQAVRETDSLFFSIGSKYTPTLVGAEDKEAAAVEWVTFENYPGVVTGLDVGLVPLRDTRFNRCKSWLKGIEYAALGVAVVATPLPEYERLAAMGVGLLANTPQKWYKRIRLLLQNDAYRQEQVEMGKKQIAENLTYERQSWKWAEAWERALLNFKHSQV